MPSDDYNTRPKKDIRRRTMEEIAELSGVSKSTVSRALAGSEQVSPLTKERILKYAYEEDLSEQRNGKQDSLGTITILAPADATFSQRMSHPFYTELTTAIIEELGFLGYSSTVAQIPIWSESAVNQYFDSRNFLGCVIIGQTMDSDAQNAFALTEKVQGLVSWGAEVPGQPFATVGSENVESSREAVNHLLRNGRKRVLFLGNRCYPETRLRYQGYIKAHQDNNLEPDERLVLDVPPFDLKQASLVIKSAFNNELMADAMFATSDLLIMTATATLAELGLKVPDDIAAVGFDDIRMASYFSPPITTVRQNIEFGARLLVEKLFRSIKGEAVRSELLSTEFVIRKSCGVIK